MSEPNATTNAKAITSTNSTGTLGMSNQVDTRLLRSPQRKKFDKRWNEEVKAWWNCVLEAFHHKNELTYIPIVYVLPFHPIAVTRIDEHHKYVRAFIGMSGPDPVHTGRYAIVYEVIKRAPKEINIANLAHELGHVYTVIKGTDVKPEELLGMSSNAEWEAKESPVKDIENSYDEPVRSMILKMETDKTRDPTIVNQYLGSSPSLDVKLFLATVRRNCRKS